MVHISDQIDISKKKRISIIVFIRILTNVLCMVLYFLISPLFYYRNESISDGLQYIKTACMTTSK